MYHIVENLSKTIIPDYFETKAQAEEFKSEFLSSCQVRTHLCIVNDEKLDRLREKSGTYRMIFQEKCFRYKLMLKGDIDHELICLGFKQGDTITAFIDRFNRKGAMNFVASLNGSTYNCVVWPENYDIVEKS